MSDQRTRIRVDLHIPRRAAALGDDGSRDVRPLADWRSLDAYVLLGDPGAGKSECLDFEANTTDGTYISARDFITLGVDAEQAGRTLFIDGLDEMRAGRANGHIPLDELRSRLKAMGSPRFRLSCREHDWRTQTDLAALNQVAPGGSVQELHLEPLSRDEQLQILRARAAEIEEPDGFLQRAEELGLANLFGNPLLLDLTIRAVATKGRWPDSRRDIYELSCRELATERSEVHRHARPFEPGKVDQVLDDAGLLCAVLLLSGKASLTQDLEPKPSSIALHTLPADLRLQDADAALGSKVFATTAGEYAPRHRSIAEYLAARALAKRLQDDAVPLGRVLALMQGRDGGIVEPLRGLLGWLSVHDARDRDRLVRLDPLSAVLNGDLATFSTSAKLALLGALRHEAQRNQWFRRDWVSYPFAPLSSQDMAEALEQVLSNHSTDASNQALVACVLDALNSGEPLSRLGPALESWVEDPNAWFRNRFDALLAWKRVQFSRAKAHDWLDRLHQGKLLDNNARLAGELLLSLYPEHLGPSEVLRYWPQNIDANTIVPRFWYEGLMQLSQPEDFAVLADVWVQAPPAKLRPHHDGTWARLAGSILANALEQSGDQVSDERLHAWLGLGMDKHGFSKLDPESGGAEVALWLADHPQRLKAVVSIGWDATNPDPTSGRRYFWESEQRLHRAQLPRDWFRWLLKKAGETSSQELARYCFAKVAHAVVDPPPGFDVPSMEDLEAWVETSTSRWPQAGDWLAAEWTCLLENSWQSEDARQRRKLEAEALVNREARRAAFAPHLDAIVAGSAPPQVLHQVVLAYDERFYDIKGDSPEKRVQDLLVASEEVARQAIAGVPRVLERNDLPSADETLLLDTKGRYHLLRPVALLAAKLSFENDPEVIDTWSESLLSALVACWLTEGTGDTPGWYEQAAASRPAVVAPVLIRHALKRLRRKGPLFVTGLWPLSREPRHADLARLILLPILERFPHRESEPARRELNGSLLPGLHLLDETTVRTLITKKVENPSIGAAQRISWLVAELSYNPDAADRLVEAVGKSERRATALGVALHEQRSLDMTLKGVPAATLSRLIELLAPITRPERTLGAHWVGPSDERRDTVRTLISLLAADPRPDASAELERLNGLQHLKPWLDHLRYSAVSQQGVAREAYYVHASPNAAALMMANRAPANQADLQALTLDHLDDIQHHLRGTDVFGLQFFWRRMGNDELSPQTENHCRDLLLERLRLTMTPLGIDVVPERRAADEKRADLNVQFIAGGKRMAVPIEIKKESDTAVWLAWRDQLQSRYTIDPAADGHGIYLVLWFGDKPRPSPEGEKPTSAEHLQQLITMRVPPADRAHLVVRVLDLSMPS